MDRVLVPWWPDAARALSVGRTTVYELIATGELESVKIGAKRLVPQDAIDAYVTKLRERAAKCAPGRSAVARQ
jgi:excisionase family DNA binding protein